MHRTSAFILAFITLAAICTATVFPAAAQTSYSPWRTFTTDDGLATNEGYALIQDQAGDIWLATDAGVSRFNGSWRTYTTANGLISNRVRAITQSRDMRSIWFATLNGVSHLTIGADGGESWQSFDATSGLLNNNVRAVLAASDGSMWFGTAEGISILAVHANGANEWAQMTVKDGLPPGQVTALLQDTTGAIWAGTMAGVARFDGQRWSQVTPGNGMTLTRINAMLQDRAGDLWFATQDSGVLRRSDVDESWQQYGTADGLPDANIWSIWQDAQGDYWFGANFGGVARFSPGNEEGQAWSVFNASNSGLIANSVRAIWEDPVNSNLWFATTAGLTRYDWRQWRDGGLEATTNGARVFALAEDADDLLWAGTDTAGLFVLDRTDGNGGNWLPVSVSDDPDKPADFVTSLHFDHQGRLWVGTNGDGLYVRDEDQWRAITETAVLNDATIISMAEQEDGTLWFGTFNGLVQRRPGSGAEPAAWRVFATADGLPSARIQAMFVDSRNQLWIGTDQGAGVLRSAGWKTFSAQNSPLPANDVRALMEDGNGNLWIGTWASGIGRLEPDAGEWSVLTTTEGLVSNGIVALMRDQSGAMWVGTEGGISRFDGNTWQRYQENDGLAGGIVTTMHQDHQGIYWLATVDGLRRYQPETRPPWVRVSAVNSKPVNHSPISLTSRDEVTVDFTGGDHETPPESILFQVRLLPGMPDWQTTRNQRMRFGSLAVGAYTVQVRTRDDAMNYSPVAQTELTVVQPPVEVTLPIVGTVLLSNVIYGSVMVGIVLISSGLGIGSWLRVRRRPRQALQRKFNPYVSGEPVRRDDLFFGRNEQLKRILTILHRNSVMIHGERRIGKTSLLFHLANRLRESNDPDCVFIPVLVDLEGTPEPEFFHRVMEAVFETLPAADRDKLGLVFQPSVSSYSARDMRRDLRLIIGHLQEQTDKTIRLILLLDEVDVMNDYDQLTQQQLRGIFMEQFAQNLGAVVAGVRISKAWDRPESPWYNLFNEIELAPFGRDDAVALLQEPVKGIYRWDQDALEFVIAHANGRPYRIQQYGLEAVNHMFEAKRTTIKLADVEAAHEAILRMSET
ncbi:two-component regulator propeller domain-containing protein [Candidatus Amarolinea aalborgensis]|uniref:two-component regulator propeller domain-containing protein n=1 Tax=Candidatus Amarolinea aalborgensis TaxID=2249329 RepID=UPI003BFA0F3E